MIEVQACVVLQLLRHSVLPAQVLRTSIIVYPLFCFLEFMVKSLKSRVSSTVEDCGPGITRLSRLVEIFPTEQKASVKCSSGRPGMWIQIWIWQGLELNPTLSRAIWIYVPVLFSWESLCLDYFPFLSRFPETINILRSLGNPTKHEQCWGQSALHRLLDQGK